MGTCLLNHKWVKQLVVELAISRFKELSSARIYCMRFLQCNNEDHCIEFIYLFIYYIGIIRLSYHLIFIAFIQMYTYILPSIGTFSLAFIHYVNHSFVHRIHYHVFFFPHFSDFFLPFCVVAHTIQSLCCNFIFFHYIVSYFFPIQ